MARVNFVVFSGIILVLTQCQLTRKCYNNINNHNNDSIILFASHHSFIINSYERNWWTTPLFPPIFDWSQQRLTSSECARFHKMCILNEKVRKRKIDSNTLHARANYSFLHSVDLSTERWTIATTLNRGNYR